MQTVECDADVYQGVVKSHSPIIGKPVTRLDALRLCLIAMRGSAVKYD